MSAPFLIRDARPDDSGFILHAWRESFLERVKSLVTRDIFRAVRDGTVRVACDRQDPDTICGFAAFDDDSLLYTYVKRPLQREGIARALLEPHDIRAFGYRTNQGESRIRVAERGWEYRPRIIL